ncbi:phospholipase/carboxylesterase [Penicillium soppii]|uniref:phospholipase/carboxylesterase n=1 Tax=Penicillium soppii TaxID=69789 RepID=UPI0025496C12|nr:phospholipase/carboxylesterase [Penicillium soppii]KAJ5851675.1 phospholipase/carboxylesterase [Penicillium soppii]
MTGPSLRPKPFIISPSAPHKHTHTLVLLHGTSQTGRDFAESFMLPFSSPSLNDSSHTSGSNQSQAMKSLKEHFPGCKFIFPTGSPRKTTVFGGNITNAWFDITDFGDRTKGEMKMREGMRENTRYLSRMIEHEVEELYGKRVDTEEQTSFDTEDDETNGRVMLVGFSQGSAMGMMLLLGGELEALGILHGFGGFVGLSGWLAFRRQIDELISNSTLASGTADESLNAREKTITYVRNLLELDPPGKQWTVSANGLDKPIFLGQGELDQKVKFEWARQMRDVLAKLDMNLSFNSYAGLGHWWNDEEMSDVVSFLKTTWGTN